MKIAFSASYWKVPTVATILEDCDYIFTTNWDAVNMLSDRFGCSKINLLPHGLGDVVQNAIIAHFTEVYGNCDLVLYSHLRAAYRQSIKLGDEGAVLAMGPSYYGFEVDGEHWIGQGIEGTAPQGSVPRNVMEYIKGTV